VKHLKHTDSFEKEADYHRIMAEALEDCPGLKDRTIKRIISRVNPGFLEGLFEDRPCIRTLKYIGYAEFDCEENDEHEFFNVDHIYQSVSFNGATYTIEGYPKRIGYVYFERLT